MARASAFARLDWEARLALVRSLIRSGYDGQQATATAAALGHPEITIDQANQLGGKIRAIILGKPTTDADLVLLVEVVKKELSSPG